METESLSKKVLLADDDPSFTQLCTSIFQSAGINFSIAQNGLEAIEKAKNEQPTLILLDIMMPDIDGFEVLKKLKQDPTTSNIPVWMLTNLAQQLNQETAVSLGAEGYIVKAETTLQPTSLATFTHQSLYARIIRLNGKQSF
jgi:CheY-like chemotaxis protein